MRVVPTAANQHGVPRRRWAGVVLLVLLGSVASAGGGEAGSPSASATIEQAQALEQRGDLAAARSAWERVIDTCYATATPDELRQGRLGLHRLNSRVPPNRDLAKAQVWTVVVFIFRTLDFSWTPKGGGPRHVVTTVTPGEMSRIGLGMQRFSELVFRYTRGQLRIGYRFEVVEEPVRRLEGEDRFWLSPVNVRSQIAKRYVPGEVDSIFAYVKLGELPPYPGQEDRGGIPALMFGGTYGGDEWVGLGGTGWTCFMWFPEWLYADGEVELHEWLHQVDWAFTHRLGYPDDLVPSSDEGRKEGEAGGDLDFRRRPGDTNWLGFYEHLMSEHLTSRMWQQARCRPSVGARGGKPAGKPGSG